MITNTTVSQTIDLAEDKIRYDEVCKRLLSEKMILAWIMKTCLSEYADLDVRTIAAQYIEGIPQIGNAPIGQNISDIPLIHQFGTEDTTITEQTIMYDIRFSAIAPRSNGTVGLLINVEAQNAFYPGYPLIKRGIYYGSRMISAQYGTIFTKSHYEKIQKVYSIWLCMDPPKKRKETITRYSIQEETVYGNATENRENYDLLNVIIICLGEPLQKVASDDTLPARLVYLLEVLFSATVTADIKKYILETEYNIPMTESLERMVDDMCNLSDAVEAKGIAEGMEKGIEKGICSLVEVCQELGKSLVDTIETVASKFGLDETESRAKVEKYWKK